MTGYDRFARARRQAHETLPRFFELARSGLPGAYLVKMAITHRGHTEHVWVEVTGLRDGVFEGLLANDPQGDQPLKAGDHMTVQLSEISDWMVNTGQHRYGGYSIRAMLDDMPKALADELRRQLRD